MKLSLYSYTTFIIDMKTYVQTTLKLRMKLESHKHLINNFGKNVIFSFYIIHITGFK